jgi:hypothetical protein
MRAQRFPLELPVEYRPLGRGKWHRASTANISASGVLVQGASLPTVDTLVEFRVCLATGGRPACGEVSGSGRVVRVVEPSRPGHAAFALAIEKYDFRPRDAQLGHQSPFPMP